MYFPRNPVAGKITDGTFRGLNLLGRGQSGPVSAEITLEGVLRDLKVKDGIECGMGHVKRAINGALNGAMYSLHRLWGEYGMDIKDAIAVLPNLDPKGALRNVLRQTRGYAATGQISVEADATPRIRTIVSHYDDMDISNLSVCIFHALKEVLSQRQSIVDRVNRQNPLQHDVDTFRWFRDEFKRLCAKGLDEDRLCVLMPVGRGGNKHFIGSAANIIRQADAAGKRVDMLLGLNRVDYPKEVNALQLPDTHIENLYVNEDASNGMQYRFPLLLSEDVYLHPSQMGGPMKYVIDGHDPASKHRIFAIRQQKTPWNAGKNPLQRVFVRMLLDRMQYGTGKMPGQILLADADSFFMNHPTNGNEVDRETNGLAALLQEKEENHLEMIGARTRSARYVRRNGEKIPDFSLPVNDIYRLFDASGPKYLRLMVGGGTLANFPTMLALLAIVCHRYPGCRAEDVQYSVIANRAGVRWGFSETACVSNEVRQKTLEQPKRWLSGTLGLRQLYKGQKAFNGLIDGAGIRREFTSSDWKKAIAQYDKLVDWAKKHPNDVYQDDASWKT